MTEIHYKMIVKQTTASYDSVRQDRRFGVKNVRRPGRHTYD